MVKRRSQLLMKFICNLFIAAGKDLHFEKDYGNELENYESDSDSDSDSER